MIDPLKHGYLTRRRVGSWCAGLAILCVLAANARVESTGRQPADSWGIGQIVPIAVSDGRACFDVPTPRTGSKTLVVLSALSRERGPFPIRLSAQPTTSVNEPVLQSDGPTHPPRRTSQHVSIAPAAADKAPPLERTFQLLVRDGDPASASNYLQIHGKLMAAGRRVQVYADRQDAGVLKPDLVRDIVTTFDERVYPTAALHLGLASDVDGDGRFTVLLSRWLSRLSSGRIAVDGFVRSADFDLNIGAPFGNQCDMMYLSATLVAGPHLRTVLAHEYTHAVTYCRKALLVPRGGTAGSDEEGWLDEAIAHLTEDLHGFSRSNLEYRVSAFLSAPERYRLVVEDYYSDNLFRSHGNRGSTYLFLRWCADRYGMGLLGALIDSEKRGIENLEAATGATFAGLYRLWSVDLFWKSLRAEEPGPQRHEDGWLLAGPRPSRVVPGGANESWSAAGTSSHFAVIEASMSGAVRVTVEGPADAEIQVTAVRLPEDMPHVEMSARLLAGGEPPRVALSVSEHDGIPIRLESLGWEARVPSADPHRADTCRGRLDDARISAVFGAATLPARGRITTLPIPLPRYRASDGPLIFKLVGTDPEGRRIVAWADLVHSAEFFPARAAGVRALR